MSTQHPTPNPGRPPAEYVVKISRTDCDHVTYLHSSAALKHTRTARWDDLDPDTNRARRYTLRQANAHAKRLSADDYYGRFKTAAGDAQFVVTVEPAPAWY